MATIGTIEGKLQIRQNGPARINNVGNFILDDGSIIRAIRG